MAAEKIWVKHFNIVEYHQHVGIELPIKGEPIEDAAFLYDGRNCAVLIKNKSKAYFLTNIATDLRSKLLSAEPLLIIEVIDKEFYQGYPVKVTKVVLPYPDNLHHVVEEMLQKIADKYGPSSLQQMVEKFWPDEEKK
ncbi:MAG: hypothetical protein IJ099_06300 [Alphaproteobacteria bacterium]|nr:hypothetical protein [Alphaproteobacteria bacterium]